MVFFAAQLVRATRARGAKPTGRPAAQGEAVGVPMAAGFVLHIRLAMPAIRCTSALLIGLWIVVGECLQGSNKTVCLRPNA